MFDVIGAIERKKIGVELASDEWAAFVEGFLDGSVPDYQAAALLMAVCLRGMSDEETIALTEVLWKSGETLEFPYLDRPLVDKHSTGGVGDKITPILVPLLVACGCAVCKMSGRGLGHTGGTIDKLESIPGYRTQLSLDELHSQMKRVHGAMVRQTGDLAPADKKLYALRDVTATVDSISLIAASIMSKKLAGGASVICLDVKVGDGSFFKTEQAAHVFAVLAQKIGVRFGRNVDTVMTAMNQPLGYAVGNALEIREVLEVLEKGSSPSRGLMRVIRMLGAEILCAARITSGEDEAYELIASKLENGDALHAFEEIVSAQGGSIKSFHESLAELDKRLCMEITAKRDGVLLHVNALKIGEFVRTLGAGRFALTDPIDPFAGIVLANKPGVDVSKGEILARCYFNPQWPTVQRIYSGSMIAIEDAVSGAFNIGETASM